MTVFGTLKDGREVRSVVLRSGAAEAEIVTFGARLHRWQIGGGPNMTGKIATLEDYTGRMVYFGAIVAPVVNRLRDARAAFRGRVLQLEPNQSGRHCLHSGSTGTQARIWDVTAQSEDSVALSVTLADGEGGFPGNRSIGVRYELDEAALRCIISATSDAPTLMNPAQHGNFELSGTGARAGQQLQVNSDRYLPIDADVLPTGEIADVAGTPFDLRAPVEPGTHIDHNYCFQPTGAPLCMAALSGAGRTLEVWSASPGLQVFTGLDSTIALEPQHWPDAPNQPGFPSIELEPGERFERWSEFRIR